MSKKSGGWTSCLDGSMVGSNRIQINHVTKLLFFMVFKRLDGFLLTAFNTTVERWVAASTRTEGL